MDTEECREPLTTRRCGRGSRVSRRPPFPGPLGLGVSERRQQQRQTNSTQSHVEIEPVEREHESQSSVRTKRLWRAETGTRLRHLRDSSDQV